jgi:hypothetical protein
LVDEQLVTVTDTGLEQPFCHPTIGCVPVRILQCVRGEVLTLENWFDHCDALCDSQETATGHRAEVPVQEPSRLGSTGRSTPDERL